MYLVIAALGIFVLGATFLVEGGGGSTATIGIITVEDLITKPAQYDDKEISTRGTLEYDESDGWYYVTEAEARLRLSFPPGDIDELIDTDVLITGKLQYDDDGVYIEAHRIQPSEA